MSGDPSASVASGNNEVTFHYIKSTAFRVIHCDGVAGAWSPSGQFLHIALFSERTPIPVETVNKLENGTLGDQVRQVSRKGVVREVEADVVFSHDVARKVAQFIMDLADGSPSSKAKDGQDG